jgi:uncharacterized protein
MDASTQVKEGRNIIQKYGETEVVINGITYGGSHMVMADQVVALADVSSEQPMTAEQFQTVFASLASTLDIVLLGTGVTQQWPSRDMMKAADQLDVALEPMDTAAACRTFNILAEEGRRVAAVLMLKHPETKG